MSSSSTVILQKINLGMCHALTKAGIQGVESNGYTLPIDVEAYVAMFKAYVWGHHPEAYEFSYPADWWQAFKQRWLPWMDVKMTTKRVDLRIWYPDFRAAIPGHEYVVEIKGYDKENEDE